MRLEKDSIRQLCSEYHDIFRLSGDYLKQVDLVQHIIENPMVPLKTGIKVKQYRIPHAHQSEIKKQIDDMLEQQIVTPSTSLWNFPLLMVPKKVDASNKRKWRMCIDYRKLNEVIIGPS